MFRELLAFVLLRVALSEELRLRSSGIAEQTVWLSRLHPVSAENFPSTDDPSAAAMLIQTHESRVPHHHVMQLRKAHDQYRAAASSSLQRDVHANLLNRSSEGGAEYPTGLISEGKSGARVQQASIRLTNLKDSQYVGPLRVGSQGDILSVVYDTGSTNLWFASTLCEEGPCVRRHRYNPRASNTFREGDYDLHVTFGTGSLSGQQGIDDVKMSGFTVQQQTFALIEKEEGSIFDQLDFEGILGLAFPAMSANGVRPFFDQVMQQSLLQNNQFSFYFTKLPTDASAVFFGDTDSRLYHGKLTGLPVTEQYYWMVNLKDFKIGDQVIDGPKKVVFDTGTTYYTAPSSLIHTVTSYMPSTSCDRIRQGQSGRPDMTFTVIGHGGAEVPIRIKPHEYYVSSGIDDRCDPAWMSIEVPSPHGPAYIFGEAFMRTFYTAFHRGDGSSPEVRIAHLNPDAIHLVRQLKRDQGAGAGRSDSEGLPDADQFMAASSLATTNQTSEEMVLAAAAGAKSSLMAMEATPALKGGMKWVRDNRDPQMALTPADE